MSKITKKVVGSEKTEVIEKPTEITALTPKEQKDVKIIERVIENREISPQDAFGKLSRPQVQLIKNTIAKGASDDELRLFIQVCKGANLNPFLKQVFLVPRWDSKEGREVRAIQVSIDGFRSIAESGGAYAGNDDPIFEGEKDIELVKDKKKLTVPLLAKVTVYKVVQGQRYPFTATARWDEYYPGERNGFQWHIRPFLMLGKCAESLALRKCFPKLLSGMYTEAEMDRTASVDTEVRKVQSGFSTLMKLVSNSTAKELEFYQSKMEKSDKYTEDQKAEFMEAAENRLKAIGAEKAIDELQVEGTEEPPAETTPIWHKK